jgi:hypothetical protein
MSTRNHDPPEPDARAEKLHRSDRWPLGRDQGDRCFYQDVKAEREQRHRPSEIGDQSGAPIAVGVFIGQIAATKPGANQKCDGRNQAEQVLNPNRLHGLGGTHHDADRGDDRHQKKNRNPFESSGAVKERLLFRRKLEGRAVDAHLACCSSITLAISLAAL